MTSYTFADALADPNLVAAFDPSIDQLVFQTDSAALVHVTKAADSVTFTTSAGSVTLPVTIDQLADGVNISFADGSVLGVGDDAVDTTGDAGDNTLIGGTGDDQLHGRGGIDTIDGGTGDNLIYGNQGADSIVAGSGADTLYGGQDADFIEDSGGDNLIYGNLGDDEILGGTGADTAYGGQGDDVIIAGGGNDWLLGNRGADDLTGGAGTDRFVYRRAEDGGDTINDFTVGTDKITLAYRVFEIPLVSATNFVNNVTGSAAASADTRFIYAQDTDTLYFDADGTGATAAVALATFTGGADGLSASDFEVFGVPAVTTGTTGNDTLVGESGTDTLTGLAGDDLLIGDVGGDVFDGGAGADTMIGGAQADMVLYENHASAVNVNLLAGTATDGGAVTDTLIGIERVTGSAFNDTLAGDPRIFYTTFNGKVDYAGGLQLLGGGGDDVISGANGWLMDGGAGNDTITSAGGANQLLGGTGDDLLTGGAGADSLWGHAGDDVIHGGDGANQAWGGAGNDSLTAGSGNDTLIGGGGDDTVTGGSGDNVLMGGLGADNLVAGAFAGDTLDGGVDSDEDWFVWSSSEALAQSWVGTGFNDTTAPMDEVHNFVAGIDKLVFDATGVFNGGASGDVNFLVGISLPITSLGETNYKVSSSVRTANATGTMGIGTFRSFGNVTDLQGLLDGTGPIHVPQPQVTGSILYGFAANTSHTLLWLVSWRNTDTDPTMDGGSILGTIQVPAGFSGSDILVI